MLNLALEWLSNLSKVVQPEMADTEFKQIWKILKSAHQTTMLLLSELEGPKEQLSSISFFWWEN